jgi:predicted HTH transcriptional regulator
MNYIDISDELSKAKLARHICALANHGGGYVVLGFDDKLNAHPIAGDIDKDFHRDRISSIVAAYLEPVFLCHTAIVTSAAGHRHPIIRAKALPM